MVSVQIKKNQFFLQCFSLSTVLDQICLWTLFSCIIFMFMWFSIIPLIYNINWNLCILRFFPIDLVALFSQTYSIDSFVMLLIFFIFTHLRNLKFTIWQFCVNFFRVKTKDTWCIICFYLQQTLMAVCARNGNFEIHNIIYQLLK